MSNRKEQVAQHTYHRSSHRPSGTPSPASAHTRVSATMQQRLPASPHGVGHAAGWHGEDQPYQSGDYDVQHTSYGTIYDDVEEEDDDDAFSRTRPPRSALRYRSTLTADQQPPVRQAAVMPAKGQAVTIYRAHRPPQQPQPPPVQARTAHPTRRLHWLLYVGLAMLAMLAGWVLLSMLAQWWQVSQDDWHYGRPRTFQTDAVVGHTDSAAHPSHFLVLNLNRQIDVIEFPGGDASKGKIYLGPTLIGTGQELAVVTLTIKDVTGDGKLDMILNVQDSHFVFINDHGQFRPVKPGEAVNM